MAELDAADMDGVGAEWGDDLQLVRFRCWVTLCLFGVTVQRGRCIQNVA